jgi:hypothetical protein
MLVRELYMDCFQYEEPILAHYLHHLLEEEKISLDDDISRIDLNQANHQKVAEMIEKNVLRLHLISLYTLKRNQREFVFIFAASKEEAIQFFIKTFQHFPLNCNKYSLDMEIVRGNEIVSFRAMRKEYSRFPAVVGCFRREGLICN